MNLRRIIESEMAYGPSKTFAARLEKELKHFIGVKTTEMMLPYIAKGDFHSHKVLQNLCIELTKSDAREAEVIPLPTWTPDGAA